MQTIVNHRTDGEIGGIINHNVLGAIGEVMPIVNHGMSDAAPTVDQVIGGGSEEELARKLGLFRYPGRVLGSTSPNDIIQLHPDLKIGWDWITDHYAEIGLTHAQEVVWDDDFNLMAEFPEREVSVFYFGERAHAARPDSGWYQTTDEMNSKNKFIHLCQGLNIPTPKTFCYNSKSEVGDCGDFKFPVYLKISTSVSGLGIVRCASSLALQAQLSMLGYNIPFQIQEEVWDVEAFINIQYRINGGLKRVAITEQILEGCSHAGNRYPSRFNPWDFADPLAHTLAIRGIKGYFAFDFAVTEGGQVLAIECNPRYNGATYPTLIAEKLGVSQWMAKTVKVGYNTLDKIQLGPLAYSRSRRSGIVVVNWGCIAEKKLGLLFAGSKIEQDTLEKTFREYNS